MRSEATTQRHIDVLKAIAAGYTMRCDITRHLGLTDTKARVSFARLQELDLIGAEAVISSDGQRRKYSLLVPVEDAVEALQPPRAPVWSNELAHAWRGVSA